MFHTDLRPAGTPVVGTHAAAALFAPFLTGLSEEKLCVAFLDRDFLLLQVMVGPLGDGCSVPLPLREIARATLDLEARALILAHNHPGGSPEVSDADRRCTRQVAEFMRLLDVRVLDHLIFADEAVTSFRALSLL